MKHPLSVTLLLIALFFVSQVVGISLLFLDQDIEIQEGKTVVTHGTTAIGDRPDIGGAGSFLFILFGVLVGTGLVLLLIKFKAFGLWKVWFLLAVWLAMSVALEVLIPAAIALSAALVAAIWKVYRPGPVIHNLTEIFMYAGIAVLIAPLFDLMWIVLLLVVISIYDMIAVWQSKHMVKMAKAQTERNVFAGLYIPKKKLREPPPPGGVKTAILGGGDIAFPLLFSAVVLEWLIELGTAPVLALYQTLVIVVCATVALTLLFYFAKKDKFYPAMPFISLGCFAGLAIISFLI